MTDEDTHFTGQIYGRLAKLWPTTGALTDLYQRLHECGRAAFIDRVYDRVGKLWPETFTDLYQGIQRRSGRAVGEWNAAFVPELYGRITTLWSRNGGGRGTASPRREEARGRERSQHTAPD